MFQFILHLYFCDKSTVPDTKEVPGGGGAEVHLKSDKQYDASRCRKASFKDVKLNPETAGLGLRRLILYALCLQKLFIFSYDSVLFFGEDEIWIFY